MVHRKNNTATHRNQQHCEINTAKPGEYIVVVKTRGDHLETTQQTNKEQTNETK